MISRQFSYHDWRIFRERVPGWQEKYIEKLLKDYSEIIADSKKPSERFWELNRRIRKDKVSAPLRLYMTKQNMLFDILIIMKTGAITIDDLSDFSDDLKNDVLNLIDDFIG